MLDLPKEPLTICQGQHARPMLMRSEQAHSRDRVNGNVDRPAEQMVVPNSIGSLSVSFVCVRVAAYTRNKAGG